jgi:hypothetical protein
MPGHTDEVKREDDLDDERRSLGRAWGIVLGAWAVAFALLALVVAPLLFSLCARIGR